jgi:uncharacterized protein YciI
MAYYAVTRVHGPSWDDSSSGREQEKWDEHAAFMDALTEEGFVVLGGPVGEEGHVLLIVDAESEGEIEARLAADLWAPMELLRTVKIERWEIPLGDPDLGARTARDL